MEPACNKRVYIPAKDMLANAPGFVPFTKLREIHFEEVYYDILSRAEVPPCANPLMTITGRC